MCGSQLPPTANAAAMAAARGQANVSQQRGLFRDFEQGVSEENSAAPILDRALPRDQEARFQRVLRNTGGNNDAFRKLRASGELSGIASGPSHLRVQKAGQLPAIGATTNINRAVAVSNENPTLPGGPLTVPPPAPKTPSTSPTPSANGRGSRQNASSRRRSRVNRPDTETGARVSARRRGKRGVRSSLGTGGGKGTGLNIPS